MDISTTSAQATKLHITPRNYKKKRFPKFGNLFFHNIVKALSAMSPLLFFLLQKR